MNRDESNFRINSETRSDSLPSSSRVKTPSYPLRKHGMYKSSVTWATGSVGFCAQQGRESKERHLK